MKPLQYSILIICILALGVLVITANRRDTILNNYNDCVFEKADRDGVNLTPQELWKMYSEECQYGM